MSLLRKVSVWVSVWFALGTLWAESSDDIVRYGILAIVFAILANIERRANR